MIEDAGGLYGPQTTTQIFKAKHKKRVLPPRITALQALQELNCDELVSSYPELQTMQVMMYLQHIP